MVGFLEPPRTVSNLSLSAIPAHEVSQFQTVDAPMPILALEMIKRLSVMTVSYDLVQDVAKPGSTAQVFLGECDAT
jgi:hypothetical protein